MPPLPRALLVLSLSFVSACSSAAPAAPPPEAAPSSSPSPSAAGGLEVTLQAVPVPGTERAFEFVVAVVDDDGGALGFELDFGDGMSEVRPVPVAACDAPVAGETSRAPVPVAETFRVAHVYDAPGRVDPSVRVTSRILCSGVDDEVEEFMLSLDVE